MHKGNFQRRLLFSVGLFCSGAMNCAYASPIGPKMERPAQRYSDVWLGDSLRTIRGYFDTIYFNSVIPFGSQLFLHFGYEVSTYNPSTRRYEVTSSWTERSRVEMKQWEEFGWVSRQSRIIERRPVNQKITGMNFYLEIRTPAGEIYYNRGGDGDAYFYRGPVPDMRNCEDLGHEQLKICAVQIEVQKKP